MTLRAIEEAAKFLLARHKVLTKNIANVNTPNYKAIDIKPVESFKNFIKKDVELLITNPNHIAGKSKTSYGLIKQADALEVKPNGNNISIPQQIQKIATNQLNYNTVTEAYTKTNQLILTAISKSGGQ